MAKYVGRTQEKTHCKFCGFPIVWIHRDGKWLPRNRDATNHTCEAFFDRPKLEGKPDRDGPVSTRKATDEELSRFRRSAG